MKVVPLVNLKQFCSVFCCLISVLVSVLVFVFVSVFGFGFGLSTNAGKFSHHPSPIFQRDAGLSGGAI